jgi:hypothetical protein
VYQYLLHQKIKKICNEQLLDIAGVDHAFYIRFIANANTLQELYTVPFMAIKKMPFKILMHYWF